MNAYILAFVGVVTTVVSVYVAASFNLAQKQLFAATRLQAYLMHWWRWAIDTGAYVAFILGEIWDKEEQEIHKRGGSAQEFAKLRDDKKNLCTQVAEKLKEPNLIGDEQVAALKEAVTRLAESNQERMFDALKVGCQNLITGETFITDEEASCLGLAMAMNTISLKMGVIELFDGLVFLAVGASAKRDAFEPKDFIADSGKLVWRATTVGKDFHSLLRCCQTFTNSSVLKLTWRNIWQGSRISRR